MRQIKGKYIVVFLGVLMFCLTTAGSAAAIAITVDGSGGSAASFTSIQAAINAAHTGDKIIVKPGTYVESINVDKSLTIVSESGNPSNTIVKAGKDSDDIFSVCSNGVSIKGLGIKGARYAGVHLFGVNNCNIKYNKLSNNGCGIDLSMFGSGNTIDNNKISDSVTGISLGDSVYNSLSNNTISNCSSAISLFDSHDNTLKDNSISKNSEGISLIGDSNGNTLKSNVVKFNKKIGLHLYGTSNNLIYNNYFSNTENVGFESDSESSANIWNTDKTEGTNIVGGPYIGGNFWAKPDNNLHPEGAGDTNRDGILDEQYNIEGSGFVDYLPLKESKPVTITVGSDKGQAANFTSIQAAIDSASPGDIVLLHPGTYKENVNVNVTNLTLISESGSPENTSIRPASNSSDVVYVNADEVTISGLNITGPSSSPSAGIHLNGVKHCRIENNQLSGNYIDNVPNVSGGDNSSTVNNSSSSTGFGIRLDFSSQNTLASNTASNSSCGIWMNSSSNNTLNGNNVSDNKVGVYLEVSNGNTLNNSTVLNNTASGINLRNSSENLLNNSFVSSNKVSIVLQNSSRNLLNNNKVSDSTYGIRVYSFSNNNELTDNRVSNTVLH
jgi:parallel beta-helix repeat protein